MFRAILILFIVAVPVWSVYMFGLWVLVAFVVAAAATLFSLGRPQEGDVDEDTRSASLSGYHTTSMAGL